MIPVFSFVQEISNIFTSKYIGQLFLRIEKIFLKLWFSTYRDEDVTSVETFDFTHSDNGVKLYYQTSQKNFGKCQEVPSVIG